MKPSLAGFALLLSSCGHYVPLSNPETQHRAIQKSGVMQELLEEAQPQHNFSIFYGNYKK